MRQAKAFLRDVFNTADLFDTPKPVELIERILQMMNDPTALVLDSYAGSGTTGHGVLKQKPKTAATAASSLSRWTGTSPATSRAIV
ncbi:DNA methyltransferase [Chloracidobacterium validum]|nr:DNA methyltransferase [Chloracidobacterium validum]